MFLKRLCCGLLIRKSTGGDKQFEQQNVGNYLSNDGGQSVFELSLYPPLPSNVSVSFVYKTGKEIYKYMIDWWHKYLKPREIPGVDLGGILMTTIKKILVKYVSPLPPYLESSCLKFCTCHKVSLGYDFRISDEQDLYKTIHHPSPMLFFIIHCT